MKKFHYKEVSKEVSYRVLQCLVAILILTFPLFSLGGDGIDRGAPLSAKVVVLVADEWCPYNCESGSDNPGFVIDIARRIFATHGIQVRYVTMPWARAIVETRAGHFDAIVGAVPDEAPDFIYPTVSQGESIDGFFVNKGNSWVYEGVVSLSNQRLGVILDYSYGDQVDAYIQQWSGKDLRVQLAFGDEPHRINSDKLKYGRISVMLADTFVLSHQMFLSKEFGRYDLAGTLPPDPVYIAFSPVIDNAEEYSRMLSRGMVKLRQSGELERIMKRYDLNDWQ